MYEKFRYLLALQREKHFGRAALACGVSQPNLSAAIKQLEGQLGVTLVSRGARFMGFTPEGERVLDWARRIIGDYQALEADVENMRKGGEEGDLQISAVPTALPVLSRLTDAFWRRHPHARLVVSSDSSAEVLAKLEDMRAQIGVTYLGNEPLGRNAELPLYRERYCLLAGVDSPLAARATVTWEEVAAQPLCLPAADTQNRRILERIFRDAGVSVRPQMETNAVTSLASFLRTSHLATVMPRIMIHEMPTQENLVTIPIVAPEVDTLIGLIYPRRDPQPPLAASFIAEARALAPELAALA